MSKTGSRTKWPGRECKQNPVSDHSSMLESIELTRSWNNKIPELNAPTNTRKLWEKIHSIGIGISKWDMNIQDIQLENYLIGLY